MGAICDETCIALLPPRCVKVVKHTCNCHRVIAAAPRVLPKGQPIRRREPTQTRLHEQIQHNYMRRNDAGTTTQREVTALEQFMTSHVQQARTTTGIPICSVQLSSWWCLCVWEGPHALHPVSQEWYVSPMLPLKPVQCWSDWRWPFPVLSRKDRWALPLSMPHSSRRSMVWCLWLCVRIAYDNST